MFALQIGLKISQKKTELIMLNVPNPSPIKGNGKDLPTTEEFTYLVAVSCSHDGGAVGNIKNHLNKARNAFRMVTCGGHPSTAPRPS